MGLVGGQAVLEGVRMKSGDRCSLAVRTPEGAIKRSDRTVVSVRKKHKILNLPLIRGVVAFVESLSLSMDMLTKSAELQGEDLSEPETKFEKWLSRTFGDKLMKAVTGVGLVLGIVLGVGLFLLLPTLAAKGIDRLTSGFIGQYAVLRSLVEGLIRIAIFVLYIWGVSLMPDIRRTYEYHGAEHKSVFCFEAGLPLTPENARTCSRFHPRCGTSFIFVMLLLSIVINSFLTWDNIWIRVGSKILMLPVVMGLGFEFIMYAGRHENLFTKIVSAPGLWMQRITTKEPDDSQLEVALHALVHAIPAEFGGVTGEEDENAGEAAEEAEPAAEEESGGTAEEAEPAADAEKPEP